MVFLKVRLHVIRNFISNVDKGIFGKLTGDDIILYYQKFYIHLSHNFLIIVIISKSNLNRLFLFTIQVSLSATGQMDY